MDRHQMLTEVVYYLLILASRATSLEVGAAIHKKINEAKTEEERFKISERFGQVPPPSTMPGESSLVAAVLFIQKRIRELGINFPDPPAGVIAFFEEKNAKSKLFPS